MSPMYFFVKFVLAACSRRINGVITCEAAAAVAALIVYKLTKGANWQIRQ